MLENVYLDDSGKPDYANVSKTENGRVSYPIYHIDNHVPDSMAGHPKNIIFLTCDAFGVLPPVARLSPGQAMYQFLSGYTAKVAGTERGVTEPEATFSSCFGAAFMTHHPTKYADLLSKKLTEHGCNAYVVNTGWSGGGYGVGDRMPIKTTRACIDAILDGSIGDADFSIDPVFGFEVPTSLPGVPDSVVTPRESWSDKAAYDAQRKKLANMFTSNFEQFQEPGMTDYSDHGPKA
jgi:phosphoenolpyruvate carboxykinase (ATP)